MGGKVLDVKVKVGDTVNENDEVIILEAMKMELPIVATSSGTVKEVRCNKGDAVEADAVLIVLARPTLTGASEKPENYKEPIQNTGPPIAH
jgi:biotin carboxyl carrier protein